MAVDRWPLPAESGFLPDDEDLIDYLLRKLLGLPLPSTDLVKDCNLYGHLEPCEIWRQFRGGGGQDDQEHDYDDDEEGGGTNVGQAKRNDLYFFTPLTRRKNSTGAGLRIERTVGPNGGFWKGEDAGKVYHTLDGEVSWMQKRFSYRTKGNNKRKKDGSSVSWIMHEYTLVLDRPIPRLDSAAVDNLALCRIRKKDNGSKKRKKKVIYIQAIDDDDYYEDYVIEEKAESIYKEDCIQECSSMHKRRKLDDGSLEKEETKGGGGGGGGDDEEGGGISREEEMERVLPEEEVASQACSTTQECSRHKELELDGGGSPEKEETGGDDEEEEISWLEEIEILIPDKELVNSQALTEKEVVSEGENDDEDNKLTWEGEIDKWS